MSAYQVLARKWRPKTFADLVGQQHVVKALQNALDKGRLHHAYLLTGTRGVGKTTIARILAKSLNCENPTHGEPCGVCQSCHDIDAGRFVDLLEIDAASNTGIDNIREVLENAQYAPTVGKYKVYIIDEVHMLSKSAFNAMLKTLEEPPEHVKFILATTDPHKVPITVLSRCLQFVLRNMTAQQVADHLAHVLKTEQIIYEPAALALLGRAANGSMRDALSLLDQAIAMGSGSVKETDVRDMIGAVDKRYLYEILTFLMEQNGENLLAKAQEMAANAIGFDSALNDLAMLLQRLALLKTVPSAIDHDDPERDRLLHLAQYFSDEQIQLYYQCVIHGKKDLPLAPDEYAGFVMTLLRMLAFAPFAAKNMPQHGTIEGTQLHNPAEKKTELKSDISGSLKSKVLSNQSIEKVEHFSGSLKQDDEAVYNEDSVDSSNLENGIVPNQLTAEIENLSGSLKQEDGAVYNDDSVDLSNLENGIVPNQLTGEMENLSGSLKQEDGVVYNEDSANLGSLKTNEDTPPWEEAVVNSVEERFKEKSSIQNDFRQPENILDNENTTVSGSLNQAADEAYFQDYPVFDDLPSQIEDAAEDEDAVEDEDLTQLENEPMPEFNAANWAKITHRISRQISAARMGLDNMAWVDFVDGVLHLAVVQEQTKNTLNKAYFERIANALSQAYGFDIRIQTQAFQAGNGWETPLMYRARIAEENRDYARNLMEQDKTIQDLHDLFGTKWIETTIKLKDI